MSLLARRVFIPELMDDEGSDLHRLENTLRQFGLINQLFSGYRRLLTDEILAEAPASFSIVDVGAGGGDIMRWLVGRCRREGRAVRVLCLDRDPRVVRFAAESLGSVPEITVAEGDVAELARFGRFDYVFANNVLHHFTDAKIPGVLRGMYAAARRKVVISDIYRSPLAYFGFALFARAFLRKSFALTDGLRSVRKGFRVTEFRDFVADAGYIPSGTVKRRFPARLVYVVASAATASERVGAVSAQRSIR